MTKKVLQTIFGIITVAGFILAMGTVGAGDLGNISLKAMGIQTLIASVLMLGGGLGLKWADWEYVD